VLTLGCGKKGPPQPIVRIVPSPPGPLRARQIGSDVVLASTLPGTLTNGTPLDPDAELRVLRMPATDSLRPGAVSDRYLIVQFDKQARPVATLSGPALAPLVLGGRLLFVDHEASAAAAASPPGAPSAAPAAVPSSVAAPSGAAPAAPAAATPTAPAAAAPGAATPRLPRYLYALQVVEPKGRKSMLRSPSMIEICRAPRPPTDLQLETAEGEVRLDWKPGDATVQTGAQPAAAQQTGGGPAASAAPLFNVYRKLKADVRDPETPLNPAPLDAPSFIDRAFQYDVEYVYFVRATTAEKNSTCESAASPAAEVKPHDRFAPDAPTGLAVAAEGDVIRVYWFPNSEADLGGYRVYRRASDATETAFLADVPATETSFIDSGAKRGVRYYYSVSAVDTAAPVNESARSEERSEMLSISPAGASQGGAAPPGGR
jgi:hypothetical protein